jgi:hypothetical protein
VGAAAAVPDSAPVEQQVLVLHRLPLLEMPVPQPAEVPVVLKAPVGLDIVNGLVVMVVPEVDLEAMAQPVVQSPVVPVAEAVLLVRWYLQLPSWYVAHDR